MCKTNDFCPYVGYDGGARIGGSFAEDSDDFGGTVEIRPVGFTSSIGAYNGGQIAVRAGAALDFEEDGISFAPLAEFQIGWRENKRWMPIFALANIGVVAASTYQDTPLARYGVGFTLPFAGTDLRRYVGINVQHNGYVGSDGAVELKLGAGLSGSWDFLSDAND